MDLDAKLTRLKLQWMSKNIQDVLKKASDKKLSHEEALRSLIDGELHARAMKATERRLRSAHIPIHKSLADFNAARIIRARALVNAPIESETSRTGAA